MNERTLTDKQEAFVIAYIGKASFNATEAARIAGYASPRQSGTENLANPSIKARINQHLDTIREEGIGNRAVRLSQLADLNDDLMAIQRARAVEARRKIEAGEEVPAGAETGLLEEVSKQIGTGRNATIEKVWQIDKTLVQERQRVLEQAAKETGDRDKRLIELSGPDGGAIQVESAKEKLAALMQDD